MALRAVATPPPGRSPERVALADAVEQSRAATARRTALTSALVAADTAVRKAAAQVEDAEADVEKSKADAADHLLAVASGRAGDAPRTTRAARDKLQDAQDELDAHRSARDELRRQTAEPDPAPFYQLGVTAAIDAVLKAEAAQQARAVVDQANKARAELVRSVLLVQFLDARNLVDRNSLNGLTLLSQYPLSDNYERDRTAATARWRETVEALANDPDAVLDLG